MSIVAVICSIRPNLLRLQARDVQILGDYRRRNACCRRRRMLAASRKVCLQSLTRSFLYTEAFVANVRRVQNETLLIVRLEYEN